MRLYSTRLHQGSRDTRGAGTHTRDTRDTRATGTAYRVRFLRGLSGALARESVDGVLLVGTFLAFVFWFVSSGLVWYVALSRMCVPAPPGVFESVRHSWGYCKSFERLP